MKSNNIDESNESYTLVETKEERESRFYAELSNKSNNKVFGKVEIIFLCIFSCIWGGVYQLYISIKDKKILNACFGVTQTILLVALYFLKEETIIQSITCFIIIILSVYSCVLLFKIRKKDKQ